MFNLKKLNEIKDIEKQTEENCLFVLIKTKGEYIKYIHEDNLNEDLVKLALKINGANIRFIPEYYKTPEMCLLAAVTGAPSSLLPHIDQDIENICEFVESKKKDIIANIKEDNSLNFNHWKSANIFINGYWTNFHNRFSFSLIEDIPRFVQYYVDNGFNIMKRPGGPIYFKNGKCISCNKSVEGDKFEFKFDTKDFVGINGKLNFPVVRSALIKDHTVIYNVPKHMITRKLLHIIREHIDENILSLNLQASADLWLSYNHYAEYSEIRDIIKRFFVNLYKCDGADLYKIVSEKYFAHKHLKGHELEYISRMCDNNIPESIINQKEYAIEYAFGDSTISLNKDWYPLNRRRIVMNETFMYISDISTINYIKEYAAKFKHKDYYEFLIKFLNKKIKELTK